MTEIWKITGLVLLLIPLAHAAEPPAKYRPLRNEYGKPDLTGVWNFNSDVPLERPTALADNEVQTREEREQANAARDKQMERFTQTGVGAHNTYWLDYRALAENPRSSLITYPANGRLPKLVDGVRRFGDFEGLVNDAKGTHPVRLFAGGIGKDGPEDRGLFERCLLGNSGPPLSPGLDNNYLQIFQTRDHVVLLTEHIHEARIVPLDAIPAPDERLRGLTGHSRGHWEGDTLVVVTTHFTDLTPSFAGAGNAHDKVVTERFTRVAADTLNYVATIVDPKTFEDRIEITIPLANVASQLYEFACHEGNYSLPLMLSGARAQEREAAEGK